MESLVDQVMQVLASFLNSLSTGAPWILLAFFLAGIFNEITSLGWVRRKLSGRGLMPPVYASAAGILTPAWGSSVVPVGITLNRQGIAQGTILAYLISAVAINPVGLPITYGMLGIEFTVAYLITVSVGPILAGFLYNIFIRNQVSPPPIAGGSQISSAGTIELEEFEDDTLYMRLMAGLKFAFGSLLIRMSPWILLGYLLASVTKVVLSLAPESLVSQYFADPGIVPLLVAAGFASVTHVWGLGSIPFVASLVTMGLAPGAGIVVFVFGGATNLSCILPAFRFLGKRVTSIFILSSFLIAMTGGYLLNLWMAPTLELRAMMRPSWTVDSSGPVDLLQACWGSAINSIGQLGQEPNPGNVLTAAWEIIKVGMFIAVLMLLTWGLYRSGEEFVNARILKNKQKSGSLFWDK